MAPKHERPEHDPEAVQRTQPGRWSSPRCRRRPPTQAPKPICIFTSPSPTPRIASIGNRRTKPEDRAAGRPIAEPAGAGVDRDAAVVQQAEHPAAEDQRQGDPVRHLERPAVDERGQDHPEADHDERAGVESGPAQTAAQTLVRDDGGGHPERGRAAACGPSGRRTPGRSRASRRAGSVGVWRGRAAERRSAIGSSPRARVRVARSVSRAGGDRLPNRPRAEPQVGSARGGVSRPSEPVTHGGRCGLMAEPTKLRRLVGVASRGW